MGVGVVQLFSSKGDFFFVCYYCTILERYSHNQISKPNSTGETLLSLNYLVE